MLYLFLLLVLKPNSQILFGHNLNAKILSPPNLFISQTTNKHKLFLNYFFKTSAPKQNEHRIRKASQHKLNNYVDKEKLKFNSPYFLKFNIPISTQNYALISSYLAYLHIRLYLGNQTLPKCIHCTLDLDKLGITKYD